MPPQKYEPPAKGFKLQPSFDSFTELYTATLRLVHPTAKDIAKELGEASAALAKGAKERIDEVIAIAQRLRWEVEELKKEAEEARKGTEEAVKIMYDFLNSEDLKDLREHGKGEESKGVEKPDKLPKDYVIDL
jgi:hypothetical protein